MAKVGHVKYNLVPNTVALVAGFATHNGLEIFMHQECNSDKAPHTRLITGLIFDDRDFIPGVSHIVQSDVPDSS